MAMIRRFPFLQRSAGPTKHPMQQEDVEILKQLLRDSQSPVPHVSEGRLATREEVLVAAWANLAVEEPDLTIEEARRMIPAPS